MTLDDDSGTQALADGLGRHLQAWVLKAGASAATAALVQRAGRALSLAASAGHVCAPLEGLAAALDPPLPADALREGLLSSGIVGTPETPGAMPLILDADGRLYLHRAFDHERRLAARVMRAARAEPQPITPALQARLADWFGSAPADGSVDWQRLAAALALRRRFTLISGGPGTGKTTTVVNLLACLLAQDPDCRIALAAPTGKAAARLAEALRARASALPAEVAQRLPTESFTVHRLLGVRPGGGFAHGADHRLAIDALVVDEASMLDLALATRLLEAVPDEARIVLLGDQDQLAAVEAGAVFAELGADPTLGDETRAALAPACGVAAAQIVPPPPRLPTPLHDSAVWFTRNYRFGAMSAVGRLAASVRAGQTDEALVLLASGDDDLAWLDDAAPSPGAASLQRLRAGYAPYLEALSRDPSDVAAAWAAFSRFRVLCALREGPRGMQALNDTLDRQARAQRGSGGDPRSPWFVGRPVMVLRNDPALALFNGDIGLALPDAQGRLQLWFADAKVGLRSLPPARLPEHQSAWAMTVHKAQGSEFDEVLLMLPAQPSRVATRELLYTAVTRARRRVTLCGPAAVVAAAVQSPTQRHSGLLARLAEAAAA